ncbi:hypothetical protein MTBUT4_1010001 [Magnetospirillum sp. UT-4]|nr:hypothetical protein MTBUT4_1010001 [Magnetospirillum sp. UT-4]
MYMPQARNWRQIELEFKARVPIRSIACWHRLTIEKLCRRARPDDLVRVMGFINAITVGEAAH